ncbi:MAG: pyruvate, phosphate dikinase [Balneolales bacterium]
MEKNTKYVFKFSENVSEGDRTMKALLGGKGANLSEMCGIGLPVPPGFTISTEACAYFNDHNFSWPDALQQQIEQGIRHVENEMGAKFGDPKNPLLVSVRSGATVSMPGMMDTVLNLGINDAVVEGLAKKTNNERFAYDSYRRFIDMFGDVIMGVNHEHFEKVLQDMKTKAGVSTDVELDAGHLKELVDRYKAVYRRKTGFMFPEDPYEQLIYAVNAVFKSWNGARAVKYRNINKIRDLLGTAVNVQAMVYGNMNDSSATGVCFTRNPADGSRALYGEFLINAQGEDVVAGTRTPLPIKQMKEIFPEIYNQLDKYTARLEQHYNDIQDVEFTMQEGRIFILQTRSGQRTGKAAIRIAVDFVEEGIISKEKAICDLVKPLHLDQLLHKQFAVTNGSPPYVIGTGLAASPGAAVGKVVFDADLAEEAFNRGEKVILVRVETSPEDVGGMSASEGVLTSRGGMTSHAAVVARGWGKPCVSGCGDIIINYKQKSFTNGDITVKEGDWISIDGTTGQVMNGEQALTDPGFDEYYYLFMQWVDEARNMQVRANADTLADAVKALEYGAEGIGLARTEHMFFAPERITAIRRMIISETSAERSEALTKLLPYQKADFKEIFRVMNGRPVTIRLLDPPLNEFLPTEDDEIIHVSEDLGISAKLLKHKIQNLKEVNPMLGHRGCRLGIVYPEITIMQTRAILEAAVELQNEDITVRPEIMVPLIGAVSEFIHQKNLILDEANKIFYEKGSKVDIKIGTMIEVPRAALTASSIAEHADFFSFGTNDLTQTTLAYSRDDTARFLGFYLTHGILKEDPFMVIDREGVGRLITLAAKEGRKMKPELKIGICGEHGGDPDSIKFFYENDLDYVSCSPYRLPLARLALAQVHLNKTAVGAMA